MRAEDLTPVERRVRDAFSRGEKLDLRVGDPPDDEPANSDGWGPERVVRGAALTWLLRDGSGYAPQPFEQLALAYRALGHEAAAGSTETFNPVIFTLDHLLPVIGLGQGTAFTPTAGTQWIGYLLTASGRILATTIVTGVTRSLNRR
ncbi:hypothetical protein [Streptomyces sp. NPDC050538]|uniref:hypothetical protein n=1 Tax=Streptomyces sp. NPDC050538 TaxID=3365627 RepID=UPI00378E85A4